MERGRVKAIAADGSLTIGQGGRDYQQVKNPHGIKVALGYQVEFEAQLSEGKEAYRVVKIIDQGKSTPVEKHKKSPGNQPYPKKGLKPAGAANFEGSKKNNSQSSQAAKKNPAPAYATPPVLTKATQEAPYNFIPVDIEYAVHDTPVFHHGASGDELYSGELRYSIEALTPLIVGNDQYEAKFSVGVDNREKKCTLPGLGPVVMEGKKILEPLRLDLKEETRGPVVIPGESIKGAIRGLLGGLLAAPMERVAERRYSYRPNLDFGDRLVSKVAVVECLCRAKEDDRDLGVRKGELVQLDLKIVSDPADAALLNSEEVVQILFGKASTKLRPRESARSCNLDELRENFSRGRKKLLTLTEAKVEAKALARKELKKTHKNDKKAIARGLQRETTKKLDAHFKPVKTVKGLVYFPYHHGADGNRAYATAFADANGQVAPLHHPGFLIADAALPKDAVRPVPPVTINQYNRTAVLMKNEKWGHRLDHPLKEKDGYPAASNCYAPLRIGDVVYVEVESSTNRIISFGHHFRYRTAYADTIRCQLIHDGKRFKYKDRNEVSPLSGENVAVGGGKLSGARLLHGFVNNDKTDHGTLNIGKGDFSRLAGRIAFNHAIEQIGERIESKRFLNSEHGYYVAFKELGSPKASAVEFYLNQPPLNSALTGALWSYGDSVTLGTSGLDVENRSPGLRGRKVYPHQAAVNCEHAHFDWLSDCQNPEARSKGIENERATLARYVSTTATEFCGAVAFRDLRKWEFGALMAVLEPGRFASWLKTALDSTSDYAVTRRFVTKDNFAHKLGHARPLGLGSARFTIKGGEWETIQKGKLITGSISEGGETRKDAFAALWKKLQACATGSVVLLDRRLGAWFRAFWFNPDSGIRPYPRGGDTNDTLGFHTKRRVNHARRRRSNNPQQDPNRLMELADEDS